MKKITLLLAALALTASASMAQVKLPKMNLERGNAPALSILDTNMENTPALEVKLVPTGVKISEGAAALKRHMASRSNNDVICHELFENFTQGSQSKPYGPLNNEGGQIPSKYHPNSPNLFGWDIYSCGGFAMLSGSAAEFRIINIDQTEGIADIEIYVAALTKTCNIGVAVIDPNQGAVIIGPQVSSVPYDGEFYTLQTSTNAVKNFTDAHLMIYEDGGRDLAIGGIYVEGKAKTGTSSGNGNGNGNGNEDVTPPTDTTDSSIGAVTNVKHTIAANNQSFTVTWNNATGANAHELKVYNDVYTTTRVSTMNLFNADYSTIRVGYSDPIHPCTDYWMNETMYLDAMPGGCVHNLVIINGAIGFVNIPSYCDTQTEMPGFQTDIFDASATQGVFNLKMNYYATAGCGVYIMEFARLKTGGWVAVDEGAFDETNGGLMIETDETSEWDYLDITFDKLDMNKYTGEVIVALGVYSVLAVTDDYIENPENYPVFYYMRDLQVNLNNVPANSHVYYTHYDNPAAKSGQTVKGDVANNNFSYTVRGVKSSTTTTFGKWYVDEYSSNGCKWVVKDPAKHDALRGIDADASAAPAVYYNLQGQPVAQPGEGMYIRVQGGKAEKIGL